MAVREGAVRESPRRQFIIDVAIEREAALLDQAEGGDCGDEFGQRGRLVQRVGRRARPEGPRPIEASPLDHRHTYRRDVQRLHRRRKVELPGHAAGRSDYKSMRDVRSLGRGALRVTAGCARKAHCENDGGARDPRQREPEHR